MVDMPQDWTAYPPESDSGNWEIEDEYGHTATVYGEGEMAKAIALLVAAAPELLALLKRMVQYVDEYPTGGYHMNDVLKQCRDAIAKAEGRGE